MQSRIFILFVVLFVGIASRYSFAQQTTIHETVREQSEPSYVEPTSIRDTLIGLDSIVVIHTVCAPICSSHARVYNKEWKEIGVLKAPFKSAFPEAYIEAGKILWRDNDTLDYTPAP